MPEFHYHGNEITEFERFTEPSSPSRQRPPIHSFDPTVHNCFLHTSNVGHFNFSRFIDFTTYVDIAGA
jgi:hypothetical protein